MMDIVVGVGDMKVSNNPEAVIVTYALGSCIGVALYDPFAKVGGVLHYMLPESGIDPAKAAKNPFMFGDTGIPLLFKETYKYGAVKKNIRVMVLGGAQILDQGGLFNIGNRNHTILRKMFWKNSVTTSYEDVGGVVNRTLKLEVKTGEAVLKISGDESRKIKWI
jgi:chemotaxis protein CheD